MRVSDNGVELARTRPSLDQLVESDEAGIFIDLDLRGSNDPSEQRDLKYRLFSAALRDGVSYVGQQRLEQNSDNIGTSFKLSSA